MLLHLKKEKQQPYSLKWATKHTKESENVWFSNNECVAFQINFNFCSSVAVWQPWDSPGAFLNLPGVNGGCSSQACPTCFAPLPLPLWHSLRPLLKKGQMVAQHEGTDGKNGQAKPSLVISKFRSEFNNPGGSLCYNLATLLIASESVHHLL